MSGIVCCRRVLLGSLFVLAQLLGVVVHADCSRPITVAASALGQQMQVDQSGRVTGIVPEFFEVMRQQSGCQFVYQVVPRARALLMFERGEVDLITNAVRTVERDKAGHFIPIVKIPISLVTLKARTHDPLRDLEAGKLLINVVRGFNYGDEYQQLISRLQEFRSMEEVTDIDSIFKKMTKGRADGSIISAPLIVEAAREYELENELAVTPLPRLPVTVAGFYLSNKSLKAADLQELQRLFGQRSSIETYWRLFTSRTPAWSLAGAKPVQ